MLSSGKGTLHEPYIALILTFRPPSRGSKILTKLASMPAPDPSQPDSTRRVLLCLDVQAGVLSDPPRGVPSAHALRRSLARVLSAARSATPPPLIIHVRNTGDFGELDEPNTPGWQLAHAPLPHEPVIDKRKNNAFAGTKLGELVPPDAEVVIVGLQSDFSVRASESLFFLCVDGGTKADVK